MPSPVVWTLAALSPSQSPGHVTPGMSAATQSTQCTAEQVTKAPGFWLKGQQRGVQGIGNHWGDHRGWTSRNRLHKNCF